MLCPKLYGHTTDPTPGELDALFMRNTVVDVFQHCELIDKKASNLGRIDNIFFSNKLALGVFGLRNDVLVVVKRDHTDAYYVFRRAEGGAFKHSTSLDWETERYARIVRAAMEQAPVMRVEAGMEVFVKSTVEPQLKRLESVVESVGSRNWGTLFLGLAASVFLFLCMGFLFHVGQGYVVQLDGKVATANSQTNAITNVLSKLVEGTNSLADKVTKISEQQEETNRLVALQGDAIQNLNHRVSAIEKGGGPLGIEGPANTAVAVLPAGLTDGVHSLFNDLMWWACMCTVPLLLLIFLLTCDIYSTQKFGPR